MGARGQWVQEGKSSTPPPALNIITEKIFGVTIKSRVLKISVIIVLM